MSEIPFKGKGNANICFDCKKACGGCSWSELDSKTLRPRFEPVPGWDAAKTFFKNGNQKIETYHIRACPLFERDDREESNNCELGLNELRWLMRRWEREEITHGGCQMD